MARATPTGRLVRFGTDEIIVSKTDLKGRITYANHVFSRVSGYAEHELLGAPHSIVRHPAMPRCVFKLLWDTIASGREVFAYVLNQCKNGDEYWVFAHVTPTLDAAGRPASYHSNRRMPHDDGVERVQPIYALLLEEERRHADRAQGLAASTALLGQLLEDNAVDYDQFVFSLAADTNVAARAGSPSTS